MDGRKVEIFLRVVQTGSLTRAAEEMRLTQSGVSHALSALEQELGFPLLRRSRAGVSVTEEGRRLLPAARALLRAEEGFLQAADSIRGLHSGTVCIGTFTSVSVHWLPGIIKSYRAEYPGVELRILTGDYHDVEQWLTDGTVDVGFVTLPCAAPCRTIPLMDDRIMAVVPKDHRFSSLPRFPLARAADEPFISLLETSDQDLRRAMDAAGVAPNITLQTKDDYAIIAMVEKGLGISIMPELLLRGHSENVTVMELAPPTSRTLALAIPLRAEPGPAASRFIDCAVGWVKQYGFDAKE